MAKTIYRFHKLVHAFHGSNSELCATTVASSKISCKGKGFLSKSSLPGWYKMKDEDSMMVTGADPGFQVRGGGGGGALRKITPSGGKYFV